MKDKKIIRALDGVDEEFLLYAMPKRKNYNLTKILSVAASFVIVVGAVIALTLSGALNGNGGGIVPTPDGGNHGATEESTVKSPFASADSDYSKLIAAIDRFKNNQDDSWMDEDIPEDDGGIEPEAPGGSNAASKPGINTNGEYIENTDNQVSGIIEGDLMKMTDKYIFRISYPFVESEKNTYYCLKVYSVEKENSALISEYKIPDFGGRILTLGWEMYLSQDAEVITLVFRYRDTEGKSRTGVVSLDVSDVENIKEAASFSVDGIGFSSRMVDGRLLLFSNNYYYKNKIDTSDYSTFIPSVRVGDETHFINPDNFVLPEEIENSYDISYTTLIMANEKGLDIIDAVSLLGYNFSGYVSENNVFMYRGYIEKTYYDEISGSFENMSDISAIGYSKNGFTIKGVVTVPGSIKYQYSLDEKDGHLRVVTTTRCGSLVKPQYYWFSLGSTQNASLYVVNLSDNTIVASVENFAPEGEEVSSVRFEGDKLYVCTALIRLFSDPVYFFDLSDYSNITYTDTGFIEGFSTSLIDLGEGYLLGVGSEDSTHVKLEVYKKEGGSVVSVSKMLIPGGYSNEYKAYFINREHNLFGFAVRYLVDEQTNKYENGYFLVQFDGESLRVVDIISVDGIGHAIVRAAMVDGYLYITTYLDFVVKKVELQ